ncbi:MAG: type IV pilus twitching motility protein PilT [Candidatus Wallbacteria bacterium]|nr:type IV pilus twitching motility protein PilT [Candidatus Wallbacteria bacterium]
MKLADLLTYTKTSGSSDLHISSGAIMVTRLNGHLTPVEMAGPDPQSAEAVKGILVQALTPERAKTLETKKELDFALEIPNVARFRGNIFWNRNGLAAVFRVIPTEIKTFEQLGLPEACRKLAALEKGLVVVTGPTGSGKSTTLAAMIDDINRNHKRHIITVEDPIEFVHPSRQSLINQREVGNSTLSFANALKSALREDPDCILVGEMRDMETISLALTAAETGHLVFGTLHTNSAPKTVTRIIDVFPAGEKGQIRAMLADSLQGVVAQLLIPRKDKPGRVAVQEIMVCTPAIRSLIREEKLHQIPTIIQTGLKYGMQSLEQELRKFLAQGMIDIEDVAKRINDQDLLAKLL